MEILQCQWFLFHTLVIQCMKLGISDVGFPAYVSGLLGTWIAHALANTTMTAGEGETHWGGGEVRKTIYCTVCGAVATCAVAIHVACRYILYVWCHQVMRGVINVGRRQYGLVELRGYKGSKLHPREGGLYLHVMIQCKGQVFSGRCLKYTFYLLYCFERDKVVFCT